MNNPKPELFLCSVCRLAPDELNMVCPDCLAKAERANAALQQREMLVEALAADLAAARMQVAEYEHTVASQAVDLRALRELVNELQNEVK